MLKILFSIILICFIIPGEGILFLNVPNGRKRFDVSNGVDYTSSFYGIGFVPVRNLVQRKPKTKSFRPQDLYYRSTKAVFSPSMSSFCILYPDSCDKAEGWK
uniref:Peptidase A1 domain-containing protein n=1 Tax=Strongyloides stercoralis TaxID=6248 RepID=A0A0K0EA10_STRER